MNEEDKLKYRNVAGHSSFDLRRTKEGYMASDFRLPVVDEKKTGAIPARYLPYGYPLTSW